MNMGEKDRERESRKDAEARRGDFLFGHSGSASSRLGAMSFCSGFSLIEVTLALVVVGMGLLAVFHLFPTGLRAGIDATAETRCAQFADEVFNQIYAEASVAPDFTDFFVSGEVNIGLQRTVAMNGTDTIRYPAEPTKSNPGDDVYEYVRYTCEAGVDSDQRLGSVELRVWYGRAGGFENVFYADVYNFGM